LPFINYTVFIRLTVFAILISMTLHCACRLGVIDYLYRNRKAIGYSIGLIAEIPISVCKSDYHAKRNLKVITHNQHESSLPAVIKAPEINLFFRSDIWTLVPNITLLRQWSAADMPDLYQFSGADSIFHPPSVLS
jgi:hypothetical protein